MITINVMPGAIVCIGYQGEDNARQLMFDISDWVRDYGENGEVNVVYKRPEDDIPYPVPVDRDGSTVYWTVTKRETEVSHTRHGVIGLSYTLGDQVVKSARWQTCVNHAMEMGPEPVEYETITITYETRYGKTPASRSYDVPKGMGHALATSDLPVLSDDDHFFAGWGVTVGTVIYADTKLTAQWLSYIYITLSYATDHSTAPPPTRRRYVEGSSGYVLTSADLPVLAADGYFFNGWSKNAGTAVATDTTLIAQWTLDTRPIVYYGVASAAAAPDVETIKSWVGHRVDGNVVTYTAYAASGTRIYFVCPAVIAPNVEDFVVTVHGGSTWLGGYGRLTGSISIDGVEYAGYCTNSGVQDVTTKVTLSR